MSGTFLGTKDACMPNRFSRVLLWDPMDCSLPSSSVHGDSPGKNTGVGCHALLQGIFPMQGSNPGLPHCRWILYHPKQYWLVRDFSKVARSKINSIQIPIAFDFAIIIKFPYKIAFLYISKINSIWFCHKYKISLQNFFIVIAKSNAVDFADIKRCYWFCVEFESSNLTEISH